MLVSLVERNECGVPETPQTLLLNARWVEGDTLMINGVVEDVSVPA
jgi:hypothetical protein